jgi:nucleoid DNA-binding protein
MATAKKTAAATKPAAAPKTASVKKAAPATKAAAPAAKKAAPAAKKAAPVAPKAAPVAKKATAVAKKAAPVAKAPAKKTVAAPAALKPIKTAFNKSTLQAHLAESAGVEPKAVKAVLAALEATMLASVNKKGLGEFTLPGLLKVTSLAIPAKKKRRGIDPFTKQEREFPAKPATVRVKVRSLKKLKDAAV